MLMAPVMMVIYYFMDEAFWPLFATQPWGFVYMSGIVVVEGLSILKLVGASGRR
jgi:hypothetical protein